MVIITDGEDNCSTEYKGAEGLRKLGGMIARRQAADGWQFIFLGAGLDDIAKSAGLTALPFSSPASALASAGELVLAERSEI